MTKAQFISKLDGLTITGGPAVPVTQIEDLGTGAERVTTYNYNGLFQSGRNTANKFDVPFYVAGEGDPSEAAFVKDAGAANGVFQAELSVYLDGITQVKGYKFEETDATLRVAVVAVIMADTANAGEFTTYYKLVEDTGTAQNPNFINSPYNPI